jgi:hypothetical protein
MSEEETADVVDKGVKRWILVLMLLAMACIAVSIYAITDTLLGDAFKIGLDTATGIRILTRSDLSQQQFLIIILIVASSDLCLVGAMLQIVLLSRRFAKGELLTRGVVVCLQRFGWGLFAMGISEAALFPILNAYLVGQKLIDPMKDVTAAAIGSGMLTSMMAAVLVMVIAKIFRIGIRLREDADLTI